MRTIPPARLRNFARTQLLPNRQAIDEPEPIGTGIAGNNSADRRLLAFHTYSPGSNPMSVTLNEMEKVLRKEICPKCARWTKDQTCSLPAGRQCAIFRSLPDVISIVHKTQSQRIDPYAEVLRLRVCAVCPHEDDHGTCPMRDHVDCALDAYLPMVVDIVESAMTRSNR